MELEWLTVINTFDEKGVIPNEVLSFIEVMEKISNKKIPVSK
jgi:hypothetical protein